MKVIALMSRGWSNAYAAAKPSNHNTPECPECPERPAGRTPRPESRPRPDTPVTTDGLVACHNFYDSPRDSDEAGAR